jgi:hypothetical protein
LFPEPLGGEFAGFRHTWSASLGIVRVGREQMTEAIIEHTFAPIARSAAEPTR